MKFFVGFMELLVVPQWTMKKRIKADLILAIANVTFPQMIMT